MWLEGEHDEDFWSRLKDKTMNDMSNGPLTNRQQEELNEYHKDRSNHNQASDKAEQPRYGSHTFYELLGEMERLHHKKSHDYASKQDPFGNYHFAGMLSKLFDDPDDAGFVGRIGEKLFRLANLDNDGKSPLNEKIEDTELDIAVIVTLWMADRRERRNRKPLDTKKELIQPGYPFVWINHPEADKEKKEFKTVEEKYRFVHEMIRMGWSYKTDTSDIYTS